MSQHHPELANLLEEAGLRSWTRLREKFPEETFYSAGFFTHGSFGYAEFTAMGELGLTKVVNDYRAMPRYATTPEPVLRASLRLNPPDSPYHVWPRSYFSQANALLGKLEYDGDNDEEWRQWSSMIESSFLAATRRLDSQGAFGKDAERESIMLCLYMGDQSDRERFEYARLLNPTRVTKAFKQSLIESEHAHHYMSSYVPEWGSIERELGAMDDSDREFCQALFQKLKCENPQEALMSQFGQHDFESAFDDDRLRSWATLRANEEWEIRFRWKEKSPFRELLIWRMPMVDPMVFRLATGIDSSDDDE